jgi:hypothetical protein
VSIWGTAIVLNVLLVWLLRSAAPGTPARAEPAGAGSRGLAATPARTTATATWPVRLDDPVAPRLTRVQEGALKVEPSVGVREDAPDSLLVSAMTSLPLSGSSGLIAHRSATVPGVDNLVPLGSAPGATSQKIDWGNLVPGGPITGDSWAGLIRDLRTRGLDIVIVFDATGSMGGEIDQVKAQIVRIGTTLLKLIPKTRLSLVAYRDYGDRMVVAGIPLTNDLERLHKELLGVGADGGGDTPEAVHEGLHWAISKNTFLPRAKKVILIFGDAPPHHEHLGACLRMASEFHANQKGIVSTVTCRSGEKIPEFVKIAEAGGGESFFTTDTRSIMEQLIVLVFGSRHEDKVREAFRLLER